MSIVKFVHARYLFILLLLAPSFGYSQDLRDIGQLARDGAPGLALELLTQVQPNEVTNLDGWLFFERQRIAILRDWAMWRELLDRLAAFPKQAPSQLQRWAKVETANALLQTNQGGQARNMIRQLLWLPPKLLSTDEFSLYRRLVIRSYLVDNRLSDARRAMLRYTQDYGSKGDDWIKLQARVFLRTDRPADAEQLFDATAEPDFESKAIMLLAQLRAGNRPAPKVLAEARESITATDSLPVDKARFWKVIAEAAKRMRSHLTLTRALENTALFAHAIQTDQLFAITGAEIWQAYRDYALYEGNNLQLLIGQDDKWLQEANRWLTKRPERARAFFTMIMLDGATSSSKAQATQQFIDSILLKEEGILLIRKLFLDQEQFASADAIPLSARYLLVDDALSRNDISTATHLMSSLQQAPQDSDSFEWGLRRARVMVLGGRAVAGIKVLSKLIDRLEDASKDKIDQTTQVVFDLQTVGKHQQAAELFEKLLQLAIEPQLRRELLYWQADSYNALGNSVRAALLYLQSATLLDGKGYDPWGQTARFRAAEILADANLFDDAQRLYESLMKVTREPSRRASIRYKLQELWLKRQQNTEANSPENQLAGS